MTAGPPPSGYDELAPHYDLIYPDWRASMRRQAAALDRVIRAELGRGELSVLDASCGIGTQAIGLAERGYRVHGTDLSQPMVERARREAAALGVAATFETADMRALADRVDGLFDVALSADNAIAHLLTRDDLLAALSAMRARLRPGGLLVLSLRDYDALLLERPRASSPSVIDDPGGRRIVFHLFDWEAARETYQASIFILRSGPTGWTTLTWSSRSRAWRRDEVASAMAEAGFPSPRWSMPAESGFFQPLVTGRLDSGGRDAP